MSNNEYLDNLMRELAEQGVEPPKIDNIQQTSNEDDKELQIIASMEKITGKKFSDEQRKILLHHGNACILACAGSGKALVNGTGVLTPNGYVPIEKLNIGDKVFDENGQIQIVLGKYPQGKKRVCKVKFAAGEVIKCCSEHLWTIRTNNGYWETVTTADIVDMLKNKEFVEIPSVNGDDDDFLNGCCSKEYLTTLEKLLPSSDRMKELLEIENSSVINNCINVSNLDCYNNSVELLYSLYYFNNYPMLYIKHEEMKDAIVTAFEFFGASVHVKELSEDDRNNYCANYVLKVEDKSVDFRRKYIVDIEETDEEEEMTCIKVSGLSELFLTEHCIVTHNTTISVNLIAKRIMTGEIKDVSKLIYTTFSKAGAEEMKDRMDKLLKQLGMGHVNVQVRTLHSFFLSVIRTFGLNKRIIKASERTKMVRQACKDAEFTLKDDDLMVVDNLLSYQMNNLLTNKKLVDSYVNTLDDLTLEKYSIINASFRRQKDIGNCMDYDDMQYYLWLWLVKWQKSENEVERQTAVAVRNYCKAVFNDFYIDEAQDVSKIQFEIIKAIVSDPNNKNKLDKNLVFIGDDDQCLPSGTQIITEYGIKNIEDVQCWDRVLTGVGSGDTSFEAVDNISKKYINDKLVEVHTKSGRVIRATKNHVGFVKIVPRENIFYTYLMYKHDIGFRIGTTSGVRAGSRREIRNGIDVRLMQERSDKIWVIKTSDTREESLYWGAYYAYKYSIPMYRFVTSNGEDSIPKTALSEEQVTRLHQELNTFDNGLRLLTDLGMSYEFPHRVTQAEGSRCKINHSWFTTEAINKYGVHDSEISINTSNQEFIETFKDLLKITDRSTQTKYNYANGRKADSNIDNQIELINKITSRCDEKGIYVEVDRDAKFTDNKFMQMTFGNMIVGMLIPTIEEYTEGDDIIKYRVIDDEILDIHEVDYAGYVYDLSVPDIRNFAANGVIVHNCIYEWRGSDPSIILTIGAKFNMQTFVLSTNYRCLNEIVDYAAVGIKCNNSRFDKSMNAFNEGGSVKIYPSIKEDLCTLSIAALNQIKYWLAQGDEVSDIAVLSRNNFHLALLSNMLLREGIYCNMTEDMKLTKSYMYSDVKDIMSLSETTWKADLTAKVLWRLCRYMGAGNARIIASFQDSCGLSLEDALGWLIKHFVNKNMEFSKRLNINMQAEQQMQYQMAKLSKDTLDDMVTLYNTLCITDREQKIENLLYHYLQASSFMYKSKDKARSINGLVQYIINLMKKDGVDKMFDFLRVTEQLEGGTMVIPGEKLTLTTIHSAKGREWKDVIMFACDNVSQPSFDGIYGMIQDDIPMADIFENIDEERRLFYVGNTRAKENLFVITYLQPSIFILEALGAFKDEKGGNNATIVELVNDKQWQERYKDIIQEKIFSVDSKYYYNPEEYKIEQQS